MFLSLFYSLIFVILLQPYNDCCELLMNTINFKKCFLILLKILKYTCRYIALIIVFLEPAMISAAKKNKKIDDDYYEYLQTLYKMRNN